MSFGFVPGNGTFSFDENDSGGRGGKPVERRLMFLQIKLRQLSNINRLQINQNLSPGAVLFVLRTISSAS